MYRIVKGRGRDHTELLHIELAQVQLTPCLTSKDWV